MRAALTRLPLSGEQEEESFVGLWVTADGRIRQELLPDGRYVEAGGRQGRTCGGRYVVTGRHIDYRDDTGSAAVGDFVNEDVLHHGGMVLYRQW